MSELDILISDRMEARAPVERWSKYLVAYWHWLAWEEL